MEKRKSQRTFDLQKGGHRSFDLDKKTTRAFELNKEQAAPVVVSPEADSTPQRENGPKRSGNKVLRNGIIFLLVLIVAICCWLFIPKGGDEAEPVPDEPTPMVNDESSAPIADEDQGIPGEPEAIAEPEETADEEPSAEPTTPATTPKPTTKPKVTPVTASISDDIEAEARKVVDGVYGNNPERRKLLGDKYADIQARVNEMKRQGLF